jgi:hypothetical protein
MRRLNRIASTGLLAVGMIGNAGFAQDPPALMISPAKATMLVGDTRTFRAVGRNGRMRHPVRWSVSPEHAADLTIQGDEVILEAREPSSAVTLSGYSAGDAAEATIEIRSGPLTPGTQLWSVAAIPGCKTGKITQAVPTATGPDLYVQEDCPHGTVIRALTADGRELWRTGLGSQGAHVPAATAAKEDRQPTQRLNPGGNSVCDAVSPGMAKEKVSKLADERNLHLEEEQRQGDTWALEEEGFRCTIQFDSSTGAVVKKRKTIVTD